jgi:hypothetical protein
MSDAVRVLDEGGFPIQDGNPFPVTSGSGSLLDKQISKISEEETFQGQIIEDSLKEIVKQLKIMNLHLSIMTDNVIKSQDVEA